MCCNAAARGFGVRSTRDEEDWPQAALRPLPVAFFALWPRRFSLLDGLQHELCGMGEEAREHAEDIGAETELLLRSGPKLLIGRRLEQEIGIPEVQTNKGLKVNRDTLSPMTIAGAGQIGRILGHAQGLERVDNMRPGGIR
jgi:hypothetical protein